MRYTCTRRPLNLGYIRPLQTWGSGIVYIKTSCTYIDNVRIIILYMFHLSHHTAVIPRPQLFGLQMIDSVATFILGATTAERSERYISSLERTGLGVPLEVELEETQSSGADGDTIDRHVSAPGTVYNIKIWSINGASFSYDPLVASTTLLFDTGTEIASKQRHT